MPSLLPLLASDRDQVFSQSFLNLLQSQHEPLGLVLVHGVLGGEFVRECRKALGISKNAQSKFSETDQAAVAADRSLDYWSCADNPQNVQILKKNFQQSHIGDSSSYFREDESLRDISGFRDIEEHCEHRGSAHNILHQDNNDSQLNSREQRLSHGQYERAENKSQPKKNHITLEKQHQSLVSASDDNLSETNRKRGKSTSPVRQPSLKKIDSATPDSKRDSYKKVKVNQQLNDTIEQEAIKSQLKGRKGDDKKNYGHKRRNPSKTFELLSHGQSDDQSQEPSILERCHMHDSQGLVYWNQVQRSANCRWIYVEHRVQPSEDTSVLKHTTDHLNALPPTIIGLFSRFVLWQETNSSKPSIVEFCRAMDQETISFSSSSNILPTVVLVAQDTAFERIGKNMPIRIETDSLGSLCRTQNSQNSSTISTKTNQLEISSKVHAMQLKKIRDSCFKIKHRIKPILIDRVRIVGRVVGKALSQCQLINEQIIAAPYSNMPDTINSRTAESRFFEPEDKAQETIKSPRLSKILSQQSSRVALRSERRQAIPVRARKGSKDLSDFHQLLSQVLELDIQNECSKGAVSYEKFMADGLEETTGPAVLPDEIEELHYKAKSFTMMSLKSIQLLKCDDSEAVESCLSKSKNKLLEENTGKILKYSRTMTEKQFEPFFQRIKSSNDCQTIKFFKQQLDTLIAYFHKKMNKYRTPETYLQLINYLMSKLFDSVELLTGKEVREKDISITRLQKENEKLNAELRQQRKKNQSAIHSNSLEVLAENHKAQTALGRAEMLQNEVNRLRNQIIKEEQAYQNLKHKVDHDEGNYKSKINSLTHQIEQLREQARHQNIENGSKISKEEMLHQQLKQTHQRAMKDAREKDQSYIKQVSQLKKAISLHVDRERAIQTQHKQLQNRLSISEEKLRTSQFRLNNLQSQLNRVTGQYEQAQHQLEQVNLQICVIESNSNQLQKEKEVEIQILQTKCGTLEGRLEHQVRLLEEQLAIAYKEKEEEREKRKQFQQQLALLEQGLRLRGESYVQGQSQRSAQSELRADINRGGSSEQQYQGEEGESCPTFQLSPSGQSKARIQSKNESPSIYSKGMSSSNIVQHMGAHGRVDRSSIDNVNIPSSPSSLAQKVGSYNSMMKLPSFSNGHQGLDIYPRGNVCESVLENPNRSSVGLNLDSNSNSNALPTTEARLLYALQLVSQIQTAYIEQQQQHNYPRQYQTQYRQSSSSSSAHNNNTNTHYLNAHKYSQMERNAHLQRQQNMKSFKGV